MLGLRMAIGRDDHDNDDGHDDDDNDGGDGESKVESMEALMLRMRAIKGMFYHTSFCSVCIVAFC